MAYVVVNFRDREVGRWSLEGPVTIGRSSDCDIAVRDILLSRRHCQIVPYRGGWIAVDADSKNGTTCEGRPVVKRGLADGDVLSLGKTTVEFKVGRLPSNHRPPSRRPADPFEALSGTVSAFDPAEVEAYRQSNNLPTPRPMPREPEGYAKDDLYSLLSGIASSSWDSIYAEASRPRRPIPRAHYPSRPPAARSAGALTDDGGGVATLALPETMTLPRRTRLGFAEELQVPDARPTRRIVRPATPALSIDEEPATVDSVDSVDASVDVARAGLSRRVTAAIGRPFVAFGRWISGR